MNRAQKLKLLTALAEAFDRATVHCSDNDEAARFIAADLYAAGFKIVSR
jgi:hypothetical protein